MVVPRRSSIEPSPLRYHEGRPHSSAELLIPGTLPRGAVSCKTSEDRFHARPARPFDLHLVSQPAERILLPLHANRPGAVASLERPGKGGTGLGVARIGVGE